MVDFEREFWELMFHLSEYNVFDVLLNLVLYWKRFEGLQ